MITKIVILNGPNLNLVGKRQPHIYGAISFDKFIPSLKAEYQIEINYFQSNHEGFLLDKLQEIGFDLTVGIILNAGGLSHTSIALGDVVAAITQPVVEVHISDISARESFRHHSYIRPHAAHFIAGKGLAGYKDAIDFLIHLDCESIQIQ